MKKVQVLLSTYNGERYLEDQLESILNQDYPEIGILIRDDGSNDKTYQIIENYAKKYKKIQYYSGKNIGSMKSFFNLLENADISCDYYSLADQDDVWKSNKISQAVESVQNTEKVTQHDMPVLYSCGVEVVDENLQIFNKVLKKHKYEPAFGNSLIENICFGCTIVFNKELLTLIKNNLPQHAYMHDWWIYMIGSCYGKVIYDQKAYLFYRLHNKNTVGTPTGFIDKLVRRIRNYNTKRFVIIKQAQEFEALLKPQDNNLKILKYIIDYKENFCYRMRIVFSKEIFRQNKLDNLIFKLLFLIGQI